MTGLLVSVRSVAEAEIALTAGADIIDVKEPSRGALGAADPSVWREILSAVGDRAITSAVLGELSQNACQRLAPQTAGFKFAKIGFSNCGLRRDWHRAWEQVLRALPSNVQLVPVAYADWQSAQAPSPLEILQSVATPSRLLVLDTFDKTSGSLLDILAWTEIESLVRHAQAQDTYLVLAGGLQKAAIERLLVLQPALIGVRGAVCRGGRADSIDRTRVERLVALLRGATVGANARPSQARQFSFQSATRE